ncbi:MAG: glutathione S-transferase family protein [Colwellia sp.]|nr:glutathione S-transferase family protein [Colwellia sp.]
MYTLYYMQGACSLATQVVLHELNKTVTIIDKNNVDDFNAINPVGTVPVLVDGNNNLTEGAAIILHLLKKHENDLFPKDSGQQQKAIEDIMFANATMHPAYSKLFFIAKNISDEAAKVEAFQAAEKNINSLWQVVESKLASRAQLGSDSISAADIMLGVYATWGQYFPVELIFGQRSSKMLTTVQSMPSFKKSVQAEQAESNK